MSQQPAVAAKLRQRKRQKKQANQENVQEEDLSGFPVDPIVVLVLSLAFIGSVFILHIWGKYTRLN